MANNNGIANSFLFIILFFEKIVITDIAIGNIITVEAVLLTHILNIAVVNINPAIILLGLVPHSPKIFKAILLCNPLLSIAEAMIKPPKNNKTNG